MGCAADMGPAAVTWVSLQAWCEHLRLQLDPWEATALVRLSDLRLAVLNEKQS